MKHGEWPEKAIGFDSSTNKNKEMYFHKYLGHFKLTQLDLNKIQMRWWLGSSEPETILPILHWYWPHFFWDCFPEHISEVDSVQHDAVVSASLLAVSAVILGLGIWWWAGAHAIIRAADIWLKKTAVVGVASTAVDDIFLEMMQSHNALTLGQVIDIDDVCDTRMPGVEWEVTCFLYIVGSDSPTRGRGASGQAWSFVVS